MIRQESSTHAAQASSTNGQSGSGELLPSVGLLALDRQYAVLREEIRAAIERVWSS